MADFCYQCTITTFGAECADRNDFARTDPPAQDVQYPALCEGCGWTIVDSAGKCLHIGHHDDAYDDLLAAASRLLENSAGVQTYSESQATALGDARDKARTAIDKAKLSG